METLSIALVTRNRPESLRRCLASLRSQEVQPFEIVVADDSDPRQQRETRSIVERFAARYVAGPKLGLYANRNVAAAACSGTHVRTVDDDHTFPPGHLGACIEAMRRHPNDVITTGQRSFLCGEYFDTCPTANQLHPSGAGGPVANLDDNWAIADGSTIYPRVALQRFRMMEPPTRYGASYLEFGALLYHRGFRSRCLSGVLVDHHAENVDPRSEGASRLFASLAFNLYFRPNLLRAARYLATSVAREPGLAAAVPRLLRELRVRWT